ncbi:MAG TPA: gliding motility-associated C-terminal domain-containing protein [Ferruginibacter sp.]|nr:gliding motility-associated C-terminal domain-containing protein [Ferruginibacter sp.]
MKLKIPLFIISFFIYTCSYSQLCSGNTSIVWKDDFGSGASIVGPASPAINSVYAEQNYGVGPGSYSLVNYFNYQTCCWYKVIEDHTPGDTGGYFLVVDGGGASNFYSSKVTNICPNTTYTFSAWAMNMDLPAFPSSTSFIFKITDLSGNTVAQINTPIIPVQSTAPPIWVNFGITFNSGTNSTLILNVEFNSNGYNDFGFDDFEFGLCGPALSISNSTNACQTQINLQTTVTNNYPNPIYQWYKQDASGAWVTISGATGINYADNNVLTNNWYKIRVTDGGSACSYVEDSTQVTTNPVPIVISIRGDSAVCKGSASTFSATGADSYTWSTGQTGDSISINPSSTETFTVTGIKAGCPSSPKSFTVTVINPTTASIDTTIRCGTSYHNHFSTGVYADTLTNIRGCDSIQTVHLTVSGGQPDFEMANAFTPNHDGLNDCYGIKYPGDISQLTFFIYNRWGQQVFSTNDPYVCWDGTFQGQRSDPGNYVYYIKAANACGAFEKKGNVILVR